MVIAHTWRYLRTSFWFLPTILTFLIAPALVQLDERLQANRDFVVANSTLATLFSGPAQSGAVIAEIAAR